ncbi:transporter [uncultured Roseovarius sp.]|uniref:transporter n=1 Tax=uncultured Roseovarius sp. TaxID=293344 RepID=UPI00260DEA45|nr:transporter [uncultured Roseovarius sp.]
MTQVFLRAGAFCAALSLCLSTAPVSAHDDPPSNGALRVTTTDLPPLRADGHAPIGVMGDHIHRTGEVMLSYRFMHMDMEGYRSGTNGLSPEQVAGTPNGFFGMPGQPPNIRIVPTSMTMDMHMFGAMYAPSDRLTLMAMLPYVTKQMDHITFAGPAGTVRLGTFNTQSEGWGDLKVSGLYRLMERGDHKLHLNFGVSLPTGSTTERATALTPTGALMNMRMPYGMQLGSGTYDLLPGITYSGRSGNTGWGAQLTGVVRTGKNNGYHLGNEVALTTWASVQPKPWISLSGRIEAKSVGDISGRDSRMVGPSPTLNPDNYGGETVSLLAGVNLVAQRGALRGHRLALEIGAPIYQDLNGLQLETDWTAMLGWQYAY